MIGISVVAGIFFLIPFAIWTVLNASSKAIKNLPIGKYRFLGLTFLASWSIVMALVGFLLYLN